jgi:hypothetical protein
MEDQEELTTQVSPSDVNEANSRLLFSRNLPTDRCLDTPAGGKFPAFDGYIAILNIDRRITGKHFNYQLKSVVDEKQAYYDCDRTFLNSCKVNNIPVILVLVNLSTEIIYWENVSPSYIDNVLKVDDGTKYARVKFKLSNKVEKGNDFIDQCHEICLERERLSQRRTEYGQAITKGVAGSEQKDPLVTESENQLTAAVENLAADNQQLKQSEKQKGEKLVFEVPTTTESIKQKFIQSVSFDLSDKFIYYQGFVYLLEPFYIDRRGNEIRKKVREMLAINRQQEDLFLQQLAQLNLVDRVGEIVSIKDKAQIKALLNELLNKNQLDVGEILSLFL